MPAQEIARPGAIPRTRASAQAVVAVIHAVDLVQHNDIGGFGGAAVE